MACSLDCPMGLRQAECVSHMGAMQYVSFQLMFTSAWGGLEIV